MKRKVLMSAYACEPGKGSEAGIGWNWVEQAATSCELWVLTRANNRDAIDRHSGVGPTARVHWIYFDLPAWARWWKRGSRGARLYYYLWQVGAYRIARRLHATVRFDCVHHVSIGSYWMPTFLNRLPVPFIWGPVGGGERTPAPFLRAFSVQGRLLEHLRTLNRWFSERLPNVKATARRAAVALATTEETAERLRELGARQVLVLSHTALPRAEYERLCQLPLRETPPFRLVSIGRMLHWKGFHLGLAAFAELRKRVPTSEYWLIGSGAEQHQLQRLARKLGIADSLRFLGNLPRDEVLRALTQCDALVHPSFHDSGGYVCVEAMAAGRPVICLDLGGPGLLVTGECGIKIAAETPAQVVADLSRAMYRLASDPGFRRLLAAGARQRVHDGLLWERNGSLLPQLYGLGQASSAGGGCGDQRSHALAYPEGPSHFHP